MFKYKLIASDLDGTLLTPQKTVSQENEAAIRELCELGIHFVPCSGRAYEQMPSFIRNNPYVRYYIYSDGAGIYDKKTGKNSCVVFPKETACELFELFSSYDTNILMNRLGVSHITRGKKTEEIFAYYQEDAEFFSIMKEGTDEVDDLRALCYENDDIEMFCTLFHSDEDRADCTERLKKIPGIRIVNSSAHNIEVISDKAGKGNALLRLADMLSVKREETVGVGDSVNDLTMILAAGLGLAVRNSMTELIEAADEVIVSNTEHALRYILENIIKK